MKRIVFACFTLAVLALSGCGLTQKETDDIVAKSTALASDHAGEIAAKIIHEQALKDGKTEEEATAIAKKAFDIADATAKSLASAAALKAAADLDAAKGEKSASNWGAALMALLGVAGAVLKVVSK